MLRIFKKWCLYKNTIYRDLIFEHAWRLTKVGRHQTDMKLTSTGHEKEYCVKRSGLVFWAIIASIDITTHF
jgi:hypothetical protein